MRKRSGNSSLLLSLFLLMPAYDFSRSPSDDGDWTGQEIASTELLQQMISNSRNVNSLEFSIKVIYRIQGELIEKRGRFKLVNEPFRIYYKQDYPRKGMEILYVDGKYNNRILVNPNSFPWINFTLDPYGKLMTENRHQVIFEAGYRLIADILESILQKYSNDLDKIIRYHGTKVVNGTSNHHIVIEIPEFRYIHYTTREGESIASIARKRGINGYMIVENNPGIGSTRKNLGIRNIKIPNCYAKRFDFCIDKEKLIISSIKVYDEKGIFESFEFIDVELNVPFHPQEFDHNFPEYGFW